MVKDAAAQAPLGSGIGSEARDAFGALQEVVARQGASPQNDSPELRRALSECAALARRRAQPPEQYLIRIKACVREAGGAIDGSLFHSFMAQVVTFAITAYYRDD